MFSWFRQNAPITVNQNQRLLGSAENALMQASQRYQGYMKFGEVLHLQGPRISLEVLSMAVSYIQRRHPVLRSRLQINPQKLDCCLLEEDNTMQLKIREISRKHADHESFWRQEWRAREKETAAIGEGLAEFWLLQDPEDDDDDNSPREIVVICEHSICDGLSLSNAAHELLIALTDNNENASITSLSWPITMEEAIERNLSMIQRLTILTRFIFNAIYLRLINTSSIARIPLADVDFPLSNMADYCHTETCYSMLSKEYTQKLVQKCHREGITITSAVSSAIIYASSKLVSSEEDRSTSIHFSIGADTRRRCIPPVPNHDLSYHVSGMMSFITATSDIPTTSDGLWNLAKTLGHHLKACIDAGQILALGMIMGTIYQKTLGPLNMDELPTCGISSWGVLPFRKQYGQWKLVMMSPVVNMIRGVMPFTTIQTVNGILTIMFVGTDPVIPLSVLERLRDCTMKMLHQMIDD